MKEDIKNDIQSIIAKVKENLPIDEIYVFGSYAYGTPTKDSDIDLCIITEDQIGSKREMLKNIRSLIIDVVDKPVDILVYSKNEFIERSGNDATLEHKISLEGIKVYGK